MCKVAKVYDISTVMCGDEKGHPQPRHYVSCILIFDYHFCLPFCWYGWFLCAVRVECHPMHSIKFSKTFPLRVLPDLKMDRRTITPATYMCQAGCSSCDLLASVLPLLPLLGGKVPTFICYIYTYISLEKKPF